jgi:RNA recognition motif-containing protein
MNNKLHVGQLSYTVDQAGLQNLFASVGEVTSAKIITDRDSGRSKGFGFVEMASDNDAKIALEKLDGHDLNGRAIKVSVAKPQEKRERNFGSSYHRH